jgi:hypothetical protein
LFRVDNIPKEDSVRLLWKDLKALRHVFGSMGIVFLTGCLLGQAAEMVTGVRLDLHALGGVLAALFWHMTDIPRRIERPFDRRRDGPLYFVLGRLIRLARRYGLMPQAHTPESGSMVLGAYTRHFGHKVEVACRLINLIGLVLMILVVSRYGWRVIDFVAARIASL